MFGFLNPRPHGRDYRRAYARVCQHQHAHYGAGSLAFHSYEAVFLYQCALDAGAVDGRTLPDRRCCKLTARGGVRAAADAPVGRFCASVALLLASVKLDDDVRDRGGLAARAARWLLRRRAAAAENYFARLDPRFRRNVARLVADHHALEARGGPVALDEYVEPTALSFGYVFGLMAQLPGLSGRRDVLAALGRKLGAAIIAFDCAVDWKKDRRRGEFNPLPDEAAVDGALRLSAAYLAEAAEAARSAFGARSRAAQTLDRVRERVVRTNPLADVVGPTCRVPEGVWTKLKRRVRQAVGALRFAAAPAFASASAAGGDALPPGTGEGRPGEPPPDDTQKDPDPTGTSSKDASQCDYCDCCSGCDCGPSGCGDCGGCDGCACDCG